MSYNESNWIKSIDTNITTKKVFERTTEFE